MQKLPNIAKFVLFFLGWYLGIILLVKFTGFQKIYVDSLVVVANKSMATIGDDILLTFENKNTSKDDFHIQMRSQKAIDLAMEKARKSGFKTVDIGQDYLNIISRGMFFIPLIIICSFIFAYPMNLNRKMIALILGILIHHIIIYIRVLSMIWNRIENAENIPQIQLGYFLSNFNEVMTKSNYIEFNVLIAITIGLMVSIRQKDFKYFLK